MPKVLRSVYIESQLLTDALELGINLNEGFENYLLEETAKMRKNKDLPENALRELDIFADLIKTNNIENWKVYVKGRRNLIKNKVGILLSPKQIEEEIEKRLNNGRI